MQAEDVRDYVFSLGGARLLPVGPWLAHKQPTSASGAFNARSAPTHEALSLWEGDLSSSEAAECGQPPGPIAPQSRAYSRTQAFIGPNLEASLPGC